MRQDGGVSEPGFVVVAFYKFVAIDDPAGLQDVLAKFCEAHEIKGTIIIAREGLNATVSAAESGIGELIAALRADDRFRDIDAKYSHAPDHPFKRLKIKIKPEIVTLGQPSVSPAITTAKAVDPKDWNALVSASDVLLIDTRNDYEVRIGSFPGAVNPETRSFGEFPEFVDHHLAADPTRRIAMFCTGGIRCEKASAYLLARGFTNVYQLRGGILSYLERVAPDQSLWQGECFVFDERVALQEGVRQGHHRLCSECGCPVRITDDAAKPDQCCGHCDVAPLGPGADVI